MSEEAHTVELPAGSRYTFKPGSNAAVYLAAGPSATNCSPQEWGELLFRAATGLAYGEPFADMSPAVLADVVSGFMGAAWAHNAPDFDLESPAQQAEA